VEKFSAGLAILGLAGVAVLARAAVRPPLEQPRFLGPGVTLTMAELKGPPPGSNVVALEVTVTNHGQGPIRLKYADFSISDDAGERSMALLPSELASETHATPPLREGVLPSGQSRSGTLYFRTPFRFPRPFDLRVDLETAGNANISRTFWPL